MTAWQGSTRAKRLPKDWQRRRLKVLQRDRYTCQVCQGTECGNRDLEVDHIDRTKGHELGNLQTIGLRPCHVRKTAQEAQAQKQPMRRPKEKHPGLLDSPMALAIILIVGPVLGFALATAIIEAWCS